MKDRIELNEELKSLIRSEKITEVKDFILMNNIDINNGNDYLFNYVCMKNKSNFFELLCNINPPKNINSLLRTALRKKNKEIVKYILINFEFNFEFNYVSRTIVSEMIKLNNSFIFDLFSKKENVIFEIIDLEIALYEGKILKNEQIIKNIFSKDYIKVRLTDDRKKNINRLINEITAIKIERF